MRPQYLTGLALAALLAGCAQTPIQKEYYVDSSGKWIPTSDAIAERDASRSGPPKSVCDPTITNPYVIKQCADQTGAPLDPATRETLEADRRAQIQRADAANRAAAECNYVAKQAAAGPRYTGFGTGWLGPAFTNSFAGLMDGIVAGRNCQDYYRDIGVIR